MDNYNPERIQLRRERAHSDPIRRQVRRDLAGYYAMIENLDWNYGRVVEALEKTGLLERHARLVFRGSRRHARIAWHVSEDESLRRIDPHADDPLRRPAEI